MLFQSGYFDVLTIFAMLSPVYIFIWFLYKKICHYERKIINSPEFNYLTQLLSFVAHITSARITAANVPQLKDKAELPITSLDDKTGDLQTKMRQTIQKSILTIADIMSTNCDDKDPDNIECDSIISIAKLKKAFPYQAIEDTLINFILGC